MVVEAQALVEGVSEMIVTVLLSIGFWERRAMDVVPVIALCIIILVIGGIWGFVEKRAKHRENKKH